MYALLQHAKHYFIYSNRNSYSCRDFVKYPQETKFTIIKDDQKNIAIKIITSILKKD